MFPIRRLFWQSYVLCYHMCLYTFWFSHLYHQIPSIWLQEGSPGHRPLSVVPLFVPRPSPPLPRRLGRPLAFIVFVESAGLTWHARSIPICIVFLWHLHGWKSARRPMKTNHSKKFTPFSLHSKTPLHLRLMFYHSRSDFSFLCQVLCLCPQRPRVQQNSVSFNARVNHAMSQKIRWRFWTFGEAAITTRTSEKLPSEGGTANYITWLTWLEVLSCMKFLGDGREHLFQQLFILWTWHLDLDLLDLEDSTDDSGTVSLGFSSFSYMDTTCMLDCFWFECCLLFWSFPSTVDSIKFEHFL